MADKPFPNTEPEINLLLQSLAVNLGSFKSILPVANADIDFITTAAANFQYLINTAPQVSDAKEAYTKFKDAYFNGSPKDSAPAVPTFPSIAVPNPATVGLITESKAIIKRIKAAPGYTEVIGEALGLVDGGSAPMPTDELTAALSLKSLSGSRVEVSFSKQGQDAMRVDFQRSGSTDWNLAGIYTASPGIHDEPSVQPESRGYRGTLLKRNVPVGNESPIYTVVTTP